MAGAALSAGLKRRLLGDDGGDDDYDPAPSSSSWGAPPAARSSRAASRAGGVAAGAASSGAAARSGAAAGDTAEDGDGDVYVPVRQRKARALAALRARLGRGGGAGDEDGDAGDGAAAGGGGGGGGAGAEAEEVPVRAEGGAAAEASAAADGAAAASAGGRTGMSLLDQARAAAAAGALPASEEAKRAALEADIMAQIRATQKAALSSAKEHAAGIRYTTPLTTDWRPPAKIRAWDAAKCSALRQKWHILVEGESLPPPIASFPDMRFPPPILAALKAKGIDRPTPIQVQGLPVALSGRDMIGIAFTGSGKTIAFSLPLVMAALQEEMRMPLTRNEGPVGIILAPARELAKQHGDTLEHFAGFLERAGMPQLRVMSAVGGEDLRTQLAPLNKGVHMIAATPGRLLDHLRKRRFTLDLCRYIVLDEGDRMLDMGFEEDIRDIFSFFSKQRQTLIFSATMPKKIQDFAREALVSPVVVNVGRAGAANLDVIQEVEYVKHEARVLYLLTCLQKTAPPVLIFAENKRDVDDIQEYLLLKGVGAVSVHGDKSQEERNESIKSFRAGDKDVLVATDVAAKGLDFPDIQHVINFDMPKDIETYVHRIGRTGRCGKTGVATTFINNSVDERLLLDLKHLLKEAKQRVPPVLLALDDPAEAAAAAGGGGDGQCPYCGGPGHRVTECPKLERERKKIAGQTRDFLGGRGGDY